ncbi:MAG TPA: peptidoglycan DD-metalloendopeptidase family protein [Candidatus Paceibacterota bacterium]|nr:peptidoglycan DD-metalloendopeptidase family protein [Candidatus Paceibacterota bacterium]
MRQVRALLPAVFFVLALAGMGHYAHADTNEEVQAQIDQNNAQIAKLKDEIAALQKDLNATTEQKQTLQNAINALNLNIQKLTKSITLTQTQIKQKDGEIGTLAGSISETNGRIEVSQTQVADSLRQLQTLDEEPYLVTLLSGDSLSSFFDQAATLESVRTGLQSHIHTLASLKADLQSDKVSAEQKRKELASLNTDLGQQKQGLTIAKTQQSTLLEQTKSKESAYQTLIAQKQAEQASFEAALIKLAQGLGPADVGSAPPPQKGILAWPLDSVRITQYFGNTAFAQSGAYNGQGHNGVDFGASIGTPVKAALSGTVQEINQGAVKYCQYGKWVLVRHDNGLSTLYAHLSSIVVTKGQRVDTGTLLAYSGDTGYATGPHLHLTVYIASAVTFKQYTCNSGQSAYIPIVPLNAYLNPLSYLPAQ